MIYMCVEICLRERTFILTQIAAGFVFSEIIFSHFWPLLDSWQGRKITCNKCPRLDLSLCCDHLAAKVVQHTVFEYLKYLHELCTLSLLLQLQILTALRK